jgi:hypothetical protein
MKKNDAGLQGFCQFRSLVEQSVGGFAEVEGNKNRVHEVSLGILG